MTFWGWGRWGGGVHLEFKTWFLPFGPFSSQVKQSHCVEASFKFSADPTSTPSLGGLWGVRRRGYRSGGGAISCSSSGFISYSMVVIFIIIIKYIYRITLVACCNKQLCKNVVSSPKVLVRKIKQIK